MIVATRKTIVTQIQEFALIHGGIGLNLKLHQFFLPKISFTICDFGLIRIPCHRVSCLHVFIQSFCLKLNNQKPLEHIFCPL